MRKLSGIVAVFVVGCSPPAVEQAKSLIREELADGRAAQFENVVHTKDGAVCGWVNGKNRMGAYTGAEQFVVVNGKMRGEIGHPDPRSFARCVAGDDAASNRMMRDVTRALDAYENALKNPS